MSSAAAQPGGAHWRSVARGIGGCVAMVGAAMAIFGALPQARAQGVSDYPSRNILLVVPFAPGGPPDVIARVIAPSLGTTLGRSVVVENRVGASTSIGTVSVARAAPDGYTLLASSLAMVVVPFILSKPGFDPLADLKPISSTGTSVQTLVMSPALPILTVSDLVSYARAKPNEIRAAHAGIGTSPHLGLVALMQAADIQLLMVPYRGAAQAISDVVAGHVGMLMTAPSTSIALARDGKVRVLGVTGDKRLTALPEVPTLKESGFHLKSFDAGVWFGLSAPAGTPDGIVAKLQAAVEKAVQEAEVRDTLAKSDIVTHSSTPQAYGQLIAEQLVMWRDVIKQAGIRPE